MHIAIMIYAIKSACCSSDFFINYGLTDKTLLTIMQMQLSKFQSIKALWLSGCLGCCRISYYLLF